MGKSSEILGPLAEFRNVAVDGEKVAHEGHNLILVLEFLTNPILLDEVLGLDGDDSRASSLGGSKQHHEASTGIQRLKGTLIDSTQGTLTNEHFLARRNGRGHEHGGKGCVAHAFYSISLPSLSSSRRAALSYLCVIQSSREVACSIFEQATSGLLEPFQLPLLVALGADERHQLGFLGRPEDVGAHLAASGGDDFVLLHKYYSSGFPSLSSSFE